MAHGENSLTRSKPPFEEGSVRTVALMLLFLSAAFPSAAQTDAPLQEPAAARSALEPRIREVESALARIVVEQQSVYQQFQMAEGMRRYEFDATQIVPSPPVTQASPPQYEDTAREREARERCIRDYGSEMSRLDARYRELEQQRRR